ncbi:hypothetical protein PSTG_10699 [Puccinia striiformis f. sp. tritici PST-78]|uniref:Uncharacterized protein n=1 Tax=Puccinia striiformis f. sp. tritici PST-78 TaxID=1165861 RepID=A0A0L0V9Q7_9BASI|nr:hypothetical protein PSTG_10699 [Puccinia striiformis f. sp. tritici PST-78]
MAVASDDVWDEFLVLHPCARRFRNTPFPEYNDYQIIFEGHTAKGDMRQSSGTEPHEARQALGTATSREDGAAIDDKSKSRQTPPQRSGDKYGENLTMDERVAGFDVLEVESKARSFLAIKGDEHAWAWMDRQIMLKMATPE